MIIKMAVNGYFENVPAELHPDKYASGDLESVEMRGKRASWRFIDGLSNVERHDLDVDSIPPSDDYDHFFLATQENIKSTARVWIEAQQNALGDKSISIGIVSDLDVYLLNDNGKTIERLN